MCLGENMLIADNVALIAIIGESTFLFCRLSIGNSGGLCEALGDVDGIQNG